jgi:hypothetical protein
MHRPVVPLHVLFAPPSPLLLLLPNSGTVTLSDYNGSPVSAISWTNATEGTEVGSTGPRLNPRQPNTTIRTYLCWQQASCC